MEAMFTEAELARALRIKPPTLRYWRQRGLGPAYIKLNGRVIYRQSAVEAWLREREQVSGHSANTVSVSGSDLSGGEVA